VLKEILGAFKMLPNREKVDRKKEREMKNIFFFFVYEGYQEKVLGGEGGVVS